jgi:hypothetical protein
MRVMTAILGAAVALLPVSWARAEEPAAAPEDQGPPPAWADTITWGGHLEAGITANTQDPKDGVNFGHLFTDASNTPLLNQIMYTVQRPLDPKADYDLGFKFQPMVGSDARYTHFQGEFDETFHQSTVQIDIVEAWALVHTPWIGDGGTDIKIGQYVTLEGIEVIDPTGDFFYSHSYIFNFGIPFKHTGILAVSHVIPELDLYYGVDSGVNTSLGGGDNNNAAAFHGGVGLNLLDGKLTVLATTHIGPENPDTAFFRAANPTVSPNSDLRYLNDIAVIWKITDDWTAMTDLNYIHDDGFDATGYGLAQYVSYNINDWLSAGIRGEVWRDNANFFVCQFGNNTDFVRAEKGEPTSNPRSAVCGGAPRDGTTYTELTLGVNIKPPVPDEMAMFNGIVIRPEIRYDQAYSGGSAACGLNTNSQPCTGPFIDSSKMSQVTIATDIIIPF